jgi:hypothetical protein
MDIHAPTVLFSGLPTADVTHLPALELSADWQLLGTPGAIGKNLGVASWAVGQGGCSVS